MGVLSQDAGPPENGPVFTGGLLFDRPHGTPDEGSHRLATPKTRIGEWGQSELLRLSPSLVEQWASDPAGVSARTPRPVEPPEGSRLAIEQKRQAAQSGPVANKSNETFLDPVRENVPHALEQCGLVEDWFCRVATFPEASAPIDEPAHLLGDVRREILHEPGEIAARCTDDQVDVAGDDAEGKEFDPMEANRAGEHASEDFVRFRGRTE